MADLAGQRQFSEIRAKIQEILFEQTAAATTTYPTLARINSEINNSYKKFRFMYPWHWALDSTTLATVSGTTGITMADTVAKVYGIQIRAQGRKLAYRPREVFLANNPYGWTNVGNGVPLYYIPAGAASNNALQFDLWPTPNAVYTLDIDYQQRIADLSGATDIPIIPPEFDQYLVYDALSELLMMLGDPRWEFFKARADEVVRRAWLDNEQQNDYQNSIRDPDTEGGYGLWPGQVLPYVRH